MQTRMPEPRAALVGLAIAIALACWTSAASALPPGRAWTPITRLSVPEFGLTVAPRLELDASGRPFLISVTRLPSAVLALDWADTTWVQRWQFGRPSLALWPVQAPPGTHYLVWRGVDQSAERQALHMAQVLEDGIQPPDTVAAVAYTSFEYSGAVSSRRRWVAVGDQFSTVRKLRVLYCDSAAIWREVPIERSFDFIAGVAMAPEGDSSVVLAWSEGFRLRWAMLEGTRWTEGAPFPDLDAFRLQFRRRPSGGQWLVSASSRYAFLRSYSVGAWSSPETLRCAYRDGLPNHFSDTPDLSRDAGEYPVITWDAQNILANYTICVCVPSDSGYGIAEELAGVEGDLGGPTVARDRNGDVWLAWAVRGDDARWIHSYVRATATPRIEGAGRHRRVAWTLSEPAPETWWAVLRARGPDDFEEVARVRAGPGLEMSWADTSPPAGLLRYKIRRESVDTRYLWESAPVWLPGQGRGLIARLVDRRPIARRGVLELVNAAPGPIELRFFDVQGRMVHQEQGRAEGAGPISIAFDLESARSPLPNGVYFATARDASGQVSQAVRLLVLR